MPQNKDPFAEFGAPVKVVKQAQAIENDPFAEFGPAIEPGDIPKPSLESARSFKMLAPAGPGSMLPRPRLSQPVKPEMAGDLNAQLNTRIGAKVAEDVPEFLKAAFAPPQYGPEKMTAAERFIPGYKMGKDLYGSTMQLLKTPREEVARAVGVKPEAVAEAAQNRDYPGLVAETAVPIAENIALGKVMEKILPAAKTAEATVPTAAERLKLKQAIRPGKDIRFDQHLDTAWGDLKDQVAQKGAPENLTQLDDQIKDAKKNLWEKSTELREKAAAVRPPIKGALPPATGEIETGVQQVRGESPGGVIPAERRAIVPEAPGGPSASVAEFPMEPVNAPQFLSGGAHPEMSGELTNPAVMSTRSAEVLRATRDRLVQVINNPEHFNSLSPTEQTAYVSQARRLSTLLEPGPRVPYGPAIDGSAVANAIERSIRPRTRMLKGGTLSELQSRADAYRGQKIPLNEAEDLLQDANREAAAWYQQATRDPHGPAYQVSSAAEAQAIREQLYKQIDQLADVDPGTAKDLKRRYGALDALHDHVVKRIPVAERQAPLNLAQQLSLGALALPAVFHDVHAAMAAPVPYAIATAARKMNSPEFLVKSALRPPMEAPELGAGTIGSLARSAIAPKKKEEKKK